MNNERHVLALKVPPVVLVAVVLILMWLCYHYITAANLSFIYSFQAAIGCVFVGAIVIIAGVRSFHKHQTTVNPMEPENSSTVVNTGVFALSRNPMYLGMLLILLGGAVLSMNTIAFILLPVFVLYMNSFQIAPEEQALLEKFGEEYLNYKAKVRRWI